MAHATPAEDPGSVPSTHIKQLTTTCNANSKGFGTLFWLLWALAMQVVHIKLCRQAYTCACVGGHAHRHNDNLLKLSEKYIASEVINSNITILFCQAGTVSSI